MPGQRGGVLGNICTDSKALWSFAGEKQELPLPERAELLESQNTEEKQEKAGGECVFPGRAGQVWISPDPSLWEDGVLRPQPLHSIRWCLSHLWHTWQSHSGT